MEMMTMIMIMMMIELVATSRQCLGMAGEEEGGESLGGGNWSTEFDLLAIMFMRIMMMTIITCLVLLE